MRRKKSVDSIWRHTVDLLSWSIEQKNSGVVKTDGQTWQSEINVWHSDTNSRSLWNNEHYLSTFHCDTNHQSYVVPAERSNYHKTSTKRDIVCFCVGLFQNFKIHLSVKVIFQAHRPHTIHLTLWYRPLFNCSIFSKSEIATERGILVSFLK